MLYILSTSASIVGMLLALALFVWAIMSFRGKSRHMSWLVFWLYVLLFFVPGVGPIPILLLLYFNVGVDNGDGYFSHSNTPYTEVRRV
jgi:hypothetical protein